LAATAITEIGRLPSNRKGCSVFTVDQRNDLRDLVLRMGRSDDRVVAAAAVGSLAVDEGDRFSDLDLTFGVAEPAPVAAVLADWTNALVEDRSAVRLVDLERGSTIYRVLLFPDALQFDLSMTPAGEFRPAGPRFRLLFGQIAAGEPSAPAAGMLFIPTPAVAEDLLGWGIIYALHARACIERQRVWQAEHYVGAVRDHGLSLACLGRGLTAAQARGYDQLPAATLRRFAQTHVAATAPQALYGALRASVAALLREAADADVPNAEAIAERVGELAA
jgi:hypothetical protein